MIQRKLAPSALGPGRGRRLQHAAEQALQRPLPQQHRAVVAQRHEGVPAPRRPLRLSPRDRAETSAKPCAWPAQPETSGQRPQAGRRGLHSVAPRSIMACAKSPARSVRRQRHGKRPDLSLGRRQRRRDGEEPRHHALDIAVDGRRPRAEGDGSDGRRGIVADAGKRAELGFGLGEAAADSAPPPRGRRHAGCGRGRNSQAPPRRREPRQARRRRAPSRQASGAESRRSAAAPP